MDLGTSQQLLDVHGAGAQRSDQKNGTPSSLPVGFGPQGDVQSIYNYARWVRNGAEFVEGAGSGADASAPPPAGNQPSGSDGQPPAGDSPPQEATNIPTYHTGAESRLKKSCSCFSISILAWANR